MGAVTAEELLEEAVGLDGRGREGEAIGVYRRAIAEGLKGERLHAALVGLGSSLRTVGDARGAVRVLDKARREFPGDPVVMMFLALAHWDAGERALAVRQLGDLVLKESRDRRLAGYRGVLGGKFHLVRK
ncbi:MAG TPA: tetratricopeptide repeat protein [Phycisphaerae bacterium]|nr:tetratricopeptide repeat protein [Phycisphaerae bacterium]